MDKDFYGDGLVLKILLNDLIVFSYLFFLEFDSDFSDNLDGNGIIFLNCVWLIYW